MYATIGSIGTYTTLPMYICKQLCTYALILVRLQVRILHVYDQKMHFWEAGCSTQCLLSTKSIGRFVGDFGGNSLDYSIHPRKTTMGALFTMAIIAKRANFENIP